jgi:hypothetical protein
MRTAMIRIAGMVSAAGLMLALTAPAPTRAAGSTETPTRILRAVNVGTVLTADGMLWQYRPDQDRWRTVDEWFQQEQGKTTHILPLPVPAESIREMVTWGFLLTDSGECWLYDLDRDKWTKLPPPPGR